MASIRTKRTLRRMARMPIARELAELANTLQSAKLHRISDKVAKLERESVPQEQLRYDPEKERFYVEP